LSPHDNKAIEIGLNGALDSSVNGAHHSQCVAALKSLAGAFEEIDHAGTRRERVIDVTAIDIKNESH
jgi:hypothetical protein